MVHNSITKIICLLIIIGLNWTGLLAIAQTFAYFNDIESSVGNTFQAGVLDMTLRSGQSNFVPGADNMNPGNQVNRDIYVGKTFSSLELKHNVSFEFVGGDIDLCNQLDLKIWYNHYHGPVSGGYDNRDMRLTYNGKLSALTNHTNNDFEIPHFDDQFDTDPSNGTEQWFYYSIILPSSIPDSFQNKVCNFNFVYEAWQNDFPNSLQGFTDQEIISNTINSGQWVIPPPPLCSFVINEVYYDPDDAHQGNPHEEKFEWIELYNACDETINLKNWYIEDNNGQEIIHPNYLVDPGQFVVIAASAAVWNTYWTLIPDNTLKIALGGNMMFDGLDNDGDRVVLYDNNDNKRDAVSWGTDTYAFVPSVSDVDEGHSIARITKGVDNDIAADWEDLSSPNPGTNPHSIKNPSATTENSLTTEAIMFTEDSIPTDDEGNAVAEEVPTTEEIIINEE